MMHYIRETLYYKTDYSGVIEEIIDLGDTYSGQLFEG